VKIRMFDMLIKSTIVGKICTAESYIGWLHRKGAGVCQEPLTDRRTRWAKVKNEAIEIAFTVDDLVGRPFRGITRAVPGGTVAAIAVSKEFEAA
jgi:hypothetical protein